MKQHLETCSENEVVLIFLTLLQIDKITDREREIISSYEKKGFDTASAENVIKPIVDFYHAKKQPPEEHKVEGRVYRHPKFMQGEKGLRPNVKRDPLAVTEHLIYHGVCALLLNGLRIQKFPKTLDRIIKTFIDEKGHARKTTWDLLSADNSALKFTEKDGVLIFDKMEGVVPTYFRSLPNVENEFDGVALPRGTRVLPAFIIVYPTADNKTETTAAVAVHPENNQCLVKFVDRKKSPARELYVITKNTHAHVGA